VISISSSSELGSLMASNSRADSISAFLSLLYLFRVAARGSSRSYRSYLDLPRRPEEKVEPEGGERA